MVEIFIEIYGWYGAFAILSAYFLNSFGLIKAESVYQILNLTGAIGIVIVSIHNGALPPAALNGAWAIIATVALINLKKEKFR